MFKQLITETDNITPTLDEDALVNEMANYVDVVASEENPIPDNVSSIRPDTKDTGKSDDIITHGRFAGLTRAQATAAQFKIKRSDTGEQVNTVRRQAAQRLDAFKTAKEQLEAAKVVEESNVAGKYDAAIQQQLDQYEALTRQLEKLSQFIEDTKKQKSAAVETLITDFVKNIEDLELLIKGEEAALAVLSQ